MFPESAEYLAKKSLTGWRIKDINRCKDIGRGVQTGCGENLRLTTGKFWDEDEISGRPGGLSLQDPLAFSRSG